MTHYTWCIMDTNHDYINSCDLESKLQICLVSKMSSRHSIDDNNLFHKQINSNWINNVQWIRDHFTARSAIGIIGPLMIEESGHAVPVNHERYWQTIGDFYAFLNHCSGLQVRHKTVLLLTQQMQRCRIWEKPLVTATYQRRPILHGLLAPPTWIPLIYSCGGTAKKMSQILRDGNWDISSRNMGVQPRRGLKFVFNVTVIIFNIE